MKESLFVWARGTTLLLS